MPNKIKQGNDLIDEIIKKGVEIDLQKEDAEPILSDEDMMQMGIPLPPDNMFDRIMEEYGEHQQIRKKGHKWKKLLIIAAVVASMLAGALSVGAVRLYIYKLTARFAGHGISMQLDGAAPQVLEVPDAEVYKIAEEELGHKLLRPIYLPQDLALKDSEVREKSSFSLRYTNDVLKKEIRFNQLLLSGETSQNTLYDGQNANCTKQTINGNEVSIVKQEQEGTGIIWYTAAWTDQTLLYELRTNYDKDELIKFIRNLK